jgi:hypothetical protein
MALTTILDLMVDYSDFGRIIPISEKEQYLEQYDQYTSEYYRSMRDRKMDPIDYTELTDDNSFKYEYIWNPCNGNAIGKDPFGPIYFSPVNILKNVYYKRLDNLWMKIDENVSYDSFERYYGDSLGSMEIKNNNIISARPERYIFRVPLIDCYLPKKHNMSSITMGALLTDDHVRDIDRVIKKYWIGDDFIKNKYKIIGSFENMKKIYDVAVSKDPLSFGREYLMSLNIDTKKIGKNNLNESINKKAVEFLKRM